MKIKKKDIAILSNLRRNGRETLTSLSRRTRIPVSTIFDKIRAQEEDSVIRRHTALLNFEKLGYKSRAFVILGADLKDREELERCLQESPNVNSMVKINNGYNFMVELVFREMNEVEGYLEDIEKMFSIKKKQVYYIISDLKREGFLADPLKIDGLFSN